jgi:hypothetical protein
MTTQKLTGGQTVVDILIRDGVEMVCAIPGHGNTALLDAFVDRSEMTTTVPASANLIDFGAHRLLPRDCDRARSRWPDRATVTLQPATALIRPSVALQSSVR